MNQLTYEQLDKTGYSGYILRDAPERVLQFGDGNFLRAFADYYFDVANEKGTFNGKIVVVQPKRKTYNRTLQAFEEQDGLYTVYLRGRFAGKDVQERRIISSVSRCINPYLDYDEFLNCARNDSIRYIVSNTTEAGICFNDKDVLDFPQDTFPGKLTRFLYERYTTQGKKDAAGFVILSCELIDHNGKELFACVKKYAELWNLESDFIEWISGKNIFCSTLVDRIVTGYPYGEAEKLNEENDYRDELQVVAEPFSFWAIEGDGKLESELPFIDIGLPIHVVEDHIPYKKRKVRILNGTYSAIALPAYLAGYDDVRSCLMNEELKHFRDKIEFEEIIPTLGFDEREIIRYAEEVNERYENPYINSKLLDISLNAVSKWTVRILPSLENAISENGKIPGMIAFSLAALLAFYHNAEETDGKVFGQRGNERYEIRDDREVLEVFEKFAEVDLETYVVGILLEERLWGKNLNSYENLAGELIKDLKLIETCGIIGTLKILFNEEKMYMLPH